MQPPHKPGIGTSLLFQVGQGVQEINMTNEELLTTLPAYVAGTLSSDKKRELEEYLDHHPSLRQYLAGLNIHVAHYDQQLSETSTTADYKHGPSEQGATGYATRTASAEDQAHAKVTKPLQLPDHQASQPKGALSPTGWKYAAVASMIALIAVSIAASRFLFTMQQLSSQLSAVQHQVSALEQQNGRHTVAAPNGSVTVPISPVSTTDGATPIRGSAPAAAPNQQELALTPVDSTTNARAYFLVDEESSLLVLSGFSPPTDGLIYQLWLTDQSGDTTFVAPLPLAPEGPTLIDIHLPILIYDYTAIGVSIVSIEEITQIGTTLFRASPTALSDQPSS